jgi:DNA-binding transcriptional MerR regulator
MADDDRLLAIGQFARASGLTAKALRHYDSVGLLRPAVVDPDSGYRFYLASQAGAAALIKCLRDLELPVAEVRKLLDLHGTDTAAMTGALAAHRKLLEARVARLQRQLHDLDHVIAEKGWHPMKRPKEENVLEDQVRRELAATLFNRVWTLLEQDKRTEAEDAEMIHAAHASCYHWMTFEPFRRARGEWQISHVYAVLGRTEPAQFHARNTLEICEREGLSDFDHGFAYEALARAAAVAGDGDEAHRWIELARGAATQVTDEGDRELLLSDLETIPAS